MNDAGAFRLPDSVRRLLSRYRRRWRTLGSVRSLLWTVGLAVGVVVLAVAADRFLRLSSHVRVIILSVLGGVCCLCMARLFVHYILRRISDRRAAVELGQHFPQVGEDLLSAVELGSDPQAQEGISRSLVASALQKIAQRAEGIDCRRAVPAQAALKALAVFLLVAGGLFFAYLLRPASVSNALARLLRPGSEIPFYSYTRLRVAPASSVIATGDAADVRIKASGAVPRAARLQASCGGHPIRADIPLAGGEAAWRSGPLFEDLVYQVYAGDAVSERCRVHVVPPPALSGRGAVLRLPEYTGEGEKVIEDLQGLLSMVAGTSVVLRVKPLSRGADPRLRCEGEVTMGRQSMPLRPDASGLLCTPAFVPLETVECSLSLIDGYGLRSRSPETIMVKVEEDRRPRVSVTTPGRDLEVLEGEAVKVEAEAEDEFGVRSLSLLCRVVHEAAETRASEPWRRRALKDGGVQARKLEGATELSVDALRLRPGQVLEYKAEASDYADEAYLRTACSAVYRLRVMSRMEHMGKVMEKVQDLRLQLMMRAQEQKAEGATAAELAETAGLQNVAEQAASAEKREREHARTAKSLAGKFEEVIADAARNPSATASLMQELERIARGVRSVAGGEMTSAAESFQKAAGGEMLEQPGELGKAAESCAEAAQRLGELARLAERLQRRSILETLAAQAEQLAAYQKELRVATMPIAQKTAGLDRRDLEETLERALDGLTTAQGMISESVGNLEEGIEEAGRRLSFTSPPEALIANEALDTLKVGKALEKTKQIRDSMSKNVLFSKLSEQEQVEETLLETAKVLRRRLDADSVEGMMRALEEFIRRQKEIISDIATVIDKDDKALRPAALGDKQSTLERDVSEQASAIKWLAMEIEQFKSATAEKLDAAAGEMRAGADKLYVEDLPTGQAHAEKALALLEESREKLKSEEGQMAAACQARQSLEALLLLQQILVGQKKLNASTGEADETRATDEAEFSKLSLGLARRQGVLRLQAERLRAMIERAQEAAQIVGKAGDKMDLSRLALEAGDTGKDTRVVQREIVALLESLLAEQQQRAGGMGLAGMRALAMARMLQQIGMSPGGYAGGENAPLLPATLQEAGDERWRVVRSRFEEELGGVFEAQYPLEFRDLLRVYFDHLRAAPPE